MHRARIVAIEQGLSLSGREVPPSRRPVPIADAKVRSLGERSISKKFFRSMPCGAISRHSATAQSLPAMPPAHGNTPPARTLSRDEKKRAKTLDSGKTRFVTHRRALKSHTWMFPTASPRASQRASLEAPD